MSKSSKRRTSKPPKNAKPAKHYVGFPLTPHSNGQWCKKRKGKQYHFGSWDDREGALAEYNAEWPHKLKFGQRPTEYDTGDTQANTRPTSTIGELCDKFMESKQVRFDCEELTLRSLKECEQATALSASSGATVYSMVSHLATSTSFEKACLTV